MAHIGAGNESFAAAFDLLEDQDLTTSATVPEQLDLVDALVGGQRRRTTFDPPKVFYHQVKWPETPKMVVNS